MWTKIFRLISNRTENALKIDKASSVFSQQNISDSCRINTLLNQKQ